MGVNLILATGVACSVGGALFMLASHRAIRNAAAFMVAYPRELDRRRVQRQDRRFGFCMMAFGCVLYALAACGFSAPMTLWRYPAAAAIAAIFVYCVARLATSRRKTIRRRKSAQKRHRLVRHAAFDTLARRCAARIGKPACDGGRTSPSRQRYRLSRAGVGPAVVERQVRRQHQRHQSGNARGGADVGRHRAPSRQPEPQTRGRDSSSGSSAPEHVKRAACDGPGPRVRRRTGKLDPGDTGAERLASRLRIKAE